MNLEIIQTLVFPLIGIVSYFAWKKYQSNDYFWIMWIGIVGFAIDILRYILNSIFILTPNLSVFMSAIFIAVWIVLIFFLLKIAIWGSRKD